MAERARFQRGSDDANQYLTVGWNSISTHRDNVAVAGNMTTFQINQIGSDGTRTPFYIETNGNVGIGTTNPSAKLEVNGPIVVSGCTGCGSGTSQWVTGGSNISFTTGNVGIGTASPVALLDLTSEGSAGSPGTYPTQNRLNVLSWAGDGPTSDTKIALLNVAAGRINSTDTYAANAYLVRVASDDGERFVVKGNGNVGIGTASPGYTLTVNGQPAASGYTTFFNYSDVRLKENVTDITNGENALTLINQLRPVTFNYNALSGYSTSTQARRISGFIAQELQPLFPEMVSTTTINGTEYLDTNLSDLPLYLVTAVQELWKQIQGIIARVTGLEDKLNAQQVEIDQLKAAVQQLQKK